MGFNFASRPFLAHFANRSFVSCPLTKDLFWIFTVIKQKISITNFDGYNFRRITIFTRRQLTKFTNLNSYVCITRLQRSQNKIYYVQLNDWYKYKLQNNETEFKQVLVVLLYHQFYLSLSKFYLSSPIQLQRSGQRYSL